MSLRLIKFCILIVWAYIPSSYNLAADTKMALPGKEITVVAKDGTEINLYHYPAKGEYLLLWVASGYPMSPRIFSMLSSLADNGIEVWLVDFSEVLFQPRSSNFLRNLKAEYVTDIIESAHKRTGKKIVAMARAYGAIPVLRGATLWQQRNRDKNYLSGIVLFSPDLYQSIPELGLEPEYVPVTRNSTIPMMIYQAKSRGTYSQLKRLLREITRTNNAVYFNVLSGVSGIFYRNDLSEETRAMLGRMPIELPGIFKLLDKTHRGRPLSGFRLSKSTAGSRMDIRLKIFKGNPEPAVIRLYDVNKTPIELSDYKGQVTVVNFWATWCPPCIHEIPSLNRLRAKMKGRKFRLISINSAEPPKIVKAFLKRVNVEFPVLMDINGSVSGQWNVVTFPSTFVIGSDGKIHYGVNAAIEWDSPEVINKLESLL